MVLFSTIAVTSFTTGLITMEGVTGPLLGVLFVSWCTHSAASMFAAALNMVDQRLLIAYPIGLLYTGFALITIF